MKHFSLVAIALFISCIALGQPNKAKSLQYDTGLYAGRVVLPDKTVLTGYLVFNDNEGIVTITNGSDQRSFNARNILSFDYNDRFFYALEFNDKEAGMASVDFFEVLKEFESFAVLVRVHKLEAESKASATLGNPFSLNPGRAFVRTNNKLARNIFQSKTIYFVDNDGNFEPYSRLTVRENPDALMLRNSKDSDLMNADLIEKYTGLHYLHLKKFAKERKLKFTNQDDLLVILNEYESVLKDDTID